MATKTFDAPYVPITTVNPSSSRRIEYTYFIYPLEKSKKHLQKWFTGEYLYITDASKLISASPTMKTYQ